jgi:hypothetical protein
MWLRILPKATGILLGSYIAVLATKNLARCWKKVQEKGGITFLAQCACYELVRQVKIWLSEDKDRRGCMHHLPGMPWKCRHWSQVPVAEPSLWDSVPAKANLCIAPWGVGGQHRQVSVRNQARQSAFSNAKWRGASPTRKIYELQQTFVCMCMCSKFIHCIFLGGHYSHGAYEFGLERCLCACTMNDLGCAPEKLRLSTWNMPRVVLKRFTMHTGWTANQRHRRGRIGVLSGKTKGGRWTRKFMTTRVSRR